MSSRLISSLATTDTLASAFSDTAFLQGMLDFETALARAEASVGLMPAAAAQAIARAAVAAEFDIDAIVRGARANATPVVTLVRMLEARVEAIDAEAECWVHFGATSQDVFDTALILCVRNAWPSLERDHSRTVDALERLAGEHSGTVMLGRTLLQPATPTTFGLKAAGWRGSLSRSWKACASAYESAMVLQFGGAAGTLAALGSKAGAVEAALAKELNLSVPDAPWHAHRDRLAALVAACGVYVGSLGKIARDISLLMQQEVGEAFERGGGSSTMAHKRNPSACAIALAAATRVPAMVAAMLTGLPQEHERSVGGWHAEAPLVADVVQTAGSASSAMAGAIEGLTIDPARMRQNIDATRGAIFAERVAVTIAPSVGRAKAAAMVKTAIDAAQRSGTSFAEAVAAMPELAALMTKDDIAGLAVPENYLGIADTFRQRLLADAVSARPSGKR